MSEADLTVPRLEAVSPRPAAFLVPWALRYGAGRATGASDYPISLAHALGERLTPGERERIIEAAVGAQVAAAANRGDPAFHVPGELERLERLVEFLERLPGAGTDEPLRSGGGRTIALVANGALRITSEPWHHGAPGSEEYPALCLAVGQLAPEFRASDRVMLLRDLAGAARSWESAGPAEGRPSRIPPCFCGLYDQIMQLPLDEDYARHNRLPGAIGLSAQEG